MVVVHISVVMVVVHISDMIILHTNTYIHCIVMHIYYTKLLRDKHVV